MGIVLPIAGEQATRENIIQIAKQAEKEEFDSLWVWERLVVPLKSQTQYPLTPDGYVGMAFQLSFTMLLITWRHLVL